MPRPNAKGKAALLIIAALIFIVVGFVFGQIAKALNTLPGDADDPVATQSYVESTVGERIATLTTRIEELEAELAALKGSGVTAPANPSTPTVTNPTNPTNPSTTTNQTGTLTVTGNSVNVRSGPGTNYDIVASVVKGDTVTKLGVEGEWYRIKTGNITGYIANYLAQ
ncbi:MAG: SH3 domain-containing protein [Firmicutes bacterium]|nr:SH3 domain-containing protein [Bacillota bacterium]